MQKDKVIIIGAGGHGRVVADAILNQSKYELIGFADDNSPVGTIVWMNYKVLSGTNLEGLNESNLFFIVAIGNNEIREDKFKMLSQKFKSACVIHPFSFVSTDVVIGEGSVILAGAVINPGTRVGNNCIINSMSLIDHDVLIGSHSHIGQASVVGSGNELEDKTHIKEKEYRPSIFRK